MGYLAGRCDSLSFIRNISLIRETINSPLLKNSLFIGTSKLVNSITGFIFWIIAAKYYSITDVGIAAALISSLALVMTFSRLGLDISLIRFMPLRDRNKVFNTCLWATSILSIIVGLAYIISIDITSPSLSFIKGNVFVFILVALGNSTVLTMGNAFLSFREGKYYLAQNAILISRLILLVPLAALGSMGIFIALGTANIAASILGAVQIRRIEEFKLGLDIDFIKESFGFSIHNYLASLLNATPLLILPVIVLNTLGAEDAAKYYIALSISNIILIVPDAISTSFFVEGSYGMNLRNGLVKALAVTYILLISSIIIICASGHLLLAIFGEGYSDALGLLRIFAISSLLVAIYLLFLSYKNIKMNTKSIIFINLFRFLLLVGTSYLLMKEYGLIGIGYAYILTYAVLMLLILPAMPRDILRRIIYN